MYLYIKVVTPCSGHTLLTQVACNLAFQSGVKTHSAMVLWEDTFSYGLMRRHIFSYGLMERHISYGLMGRHI